MNKEIALGLIAQIEVYTSGIIAGTTGEPIAAVQQIELLLAALKAEIDKELPVVSL